MKMKSNSSLTKKVPKAENLITKKNSYLMRLYASSEQDTRYDFLPSRKASQSA